MLTRSGCATLSRRLRWRRRRHRGRWGIYIQRGISASRRRSPVLRAPSRANFHSAELCHLGLRICAGRSALRDAPVAAGTAPGAALIPKRAFYFAATLRGLAVAGLLAIALPAHAAPCRTGAQATDCPSAKSGAVVTRPVPVPGASVHRPDPPAHWAEQHREERFPCARPDAHDRLDCNPELNAAIVQGVSGLLHMLGPTMLPPH